MTTYFKTDRSGKTWHRDVGSVYVRGACGATVDGTQSYTVRDAIPAGGRRCSRCRP